MADWRTPRHSPGAAHRTREVYSSGSPGVASADTLLLSIPRVNYIRPCLLPGQVSRFDGPHKRRDHRPHGPNRKRVENALDVNKQSPMGREGGVDDGDRHADIRDPRAGKPQEKCSHSLLYYCTLNCSHTKNPVWRVTSAAPVDPRVLGGPEGPKAIGCPLAVCGDRIQVRAWDGGMPCLALPCLALEAAGHGHDDRPARAPCLARRKRADVSSSSRQLFHHRCQHLGPATRSRTGPAMRRSRSRVTASVKRPDRLSTVSARTTAFPVHVMSLPLFHRCLQC